MHKRTRLGPHQALTSMSVATLIGLAIATSGATAISPAVAQEVRQATADVPAPLIPQPSMRDIVPVPQSVQPSTSQWFTLTPDTQIFTERGSSAAAQVGETLAALLRPSTGFPMRVTEAPASEPAGGISLLLHGASDRVSEDGYRLDVTRSGVVIRAHTADGLFAGVQTLRQLLPAVVERTQVQPGPWTVPGGKVVDNPRYEYRGSMLDVARHFFSVAEVERYIDEMSLYKLNYLHLHLSDDQGWRIDIKSWPKLATVGGSSEIGGGTGGHYTQAEYKQIVDYASAHHVTVVPEIDMPSHMGAALKAYPELTCAGVEGELCPENPRTFQMVDDVIGEVASMTPGPYLHLGGDEPRTLTQEQYGEVMQHAFTSAQKYGKTVVGWTETLQTKLPASNLVQYWKPTTLEPQGNDAIVSDRMRAYLNFRYDKSTPPWGFSISTGWRMVPLQQAYGWDPDSYAAAGGGVRGTESELWSENLSDLDAVEFMAFPRLAAQAEVSWSPASKLDWTDFTQRLAAQAPRLDELGIDYYRSPDVPWPTRSLPLSGTASASCVEGDGTKPQFDARYATDADLGTRWSSCRQDNAWLQLELPSVQPVGKAVIHWQAAYGRDYEIQTSTDGVRWTTAATVTGSDGAMDVIDLPGCPSAKYVRMQGVNRATTWGYSIFEFQLYAPPLGVE